MDLNYSTEDMQFRAEVRNWIAEAFDEPMRAMMAQSKNGYLDKAGQVRWQKALHARGWAAPNWPQEHGGPGWSPTRRHLFQSELAAAGCPPVSPMGFKMVAPVIMKYGTPEQKARFLPRILASEDWWCQGYSEPNAGSDLASLQMRAVRGRDAQGDHYLLNGSKIWTTHAQWADWIFCLVRTSRAERPQEGITFVLLDMRTPGVTVSALPTLDGPCDGQQEVNQVFFDDVRVPLENRIGEEGMGWAIAKYLLEFERGGSYAPMLRRQLDKVAAIAADQPCEDGTGRLIDDPVFRQRLAAMHVRVAAAEATELRVFSSVASGASIGAASSMIKVMGTETAQAISELAVDALGPYALPFVQDTWAEIQGRAASPRLGPDYAAPVVPRYFNYRKASIYGGSSEIQRNIIARQVLRL
ncbi:acyl-CoA dehydrogenase/hypothetical protein [Paraburkholderia unamae]|uniref:acyl-CoA dehydrogenase family protein n=1 Tax=Paraburkholderia unamae TaxID=219649 RepID=UPI000DC6015D|nr:acyl-CoA dehydrogenase family protein [Paraburkholderia unamae]RAR48256.1 acyl-CoA dehydrogenase/hypothetical protein [Paraburkholderia unamae]